MARILHVVNSFDPAGDVTRCVGLLNQFSKHKHRLVIKEQHPHQAIYQFPQPEGYPEWHIEWMFQECDAVLYHFVGWERGWNSIGDGKPCAFRNSNVYYNAISNRFWAAGDYNAHSLGEYNLLASSHLGAQDFLPGCKFLPAMVPIFDPRYTPDWSPRPPCVSYSKMADTLFDKQEFNIIKMPMHNVSHTSLLTARKHRATIVVDNITEGHYGLAGFEAMSLGLPFICFNAKATRIQLSEMTDYIREDYPPIIEVLPNVKDVVQAVKNTVVTDELRHHCRLWMEKYYSPERLIKRYYEPFFEELLCQGSR
jgi:hypothetical protein